MSLSDPLAVAAESKHWAHIGPGAPHAQVSLGLLSVVAELAALHPVPERQALLMAAHRAYLASPAAQEPSAGRGKKAGGSSSRSSSSSSGWVPPEAAIAAAAAAELHSSWSCRWDGRGV